MMEREQEMRQNYLTTQGLKSHVVSFANKRFLSEMNEHNQSDNQNAKHTWKRHVQFSILNFSFQSIFPILKLNQI
jgi:hypothetical protein